MSQEGCAQCNIETYTLCAHGKRLLRQCQRSMDNWLCRIFTNSTEASIAKAGYMPIAAAFYRHAGCMWADYAININLEGGNAR